MKHRDNILTQMEILASLFASPKVLTRLCQSCNVNMSRIDGLLRPMLTSGLVKDEEGHREGKGKGEGNRRKNLVTDNPGFPKTGLVNPKLLAATTGETLMTPLTSVGRGSHPF